MRKWALMTEWLCLKLYKRTRERLRTDIFFPFSIFENTLPKNLTVLWHFCSKISRFKVNQKRILKILQSSRQLPATNWFPLELPTAGRNVLPKEEMAN